MSGDVTPESLRALADKALRRGYEFDADRRAEFAHGLRAAADALEVAQGALNERAVEAAHGVIEAHKNRAKAAEAKLARIAEIDTDQPTRDRIDAILNDTEGGNR